MEKAIIILCTWTFISYRNFSGFSDNLCRKGQKSCECTHFISGFFYAIKNRPYICTLPGRIYLYMWMTDWLICALLRRIFVSIFFFTKKKKISKKTQRNFKNNLRLAALNFCRWCIFYFQPKKKIQQKHEFLRKLNNWIFIVILNSIRLYFFFN